MAKKKEVPQEPARAPEENNWEISETLTSVNEEENPMISLRSLTNFNATIRIGSLLLDTLKQKVDPIYWKDNPVEHWAVADDHITYVFRDGRKIRTEL